MGSSEADRWRKEQLRQAEIDADYETLVLMGKQKRDAKSYRVSGWRFEWEAVEAATADIWSDPTADEAMERVMGDDEPLIEEGDHTVPAGLIELYVALEAQAAGCFDREVDDAPDR